MTAREQYSQYAKPDSILKEDDPTKGKLEEILYHFAGAGRELGREDIDLRRFSSAGVGKWRI